MENSAGISFMGFTRMDLESVVCFLCAVIFSLFLMAFSWQDLHRKRIRVSWLYGFGTADERCGRTGRWLLFSDHWVLSGGMADA